MISADNYKKKETRFLRRVFFCGSLWALISLGASCHLNRPERQQINGATMGTEYTVTWLSTQNARTPAPAEFKKEIEDLLKEINASVSTYIPTSLISQINQSKRSSQAILMDDFFVDIFKLSTQVYRASAGAFNPAVGPLVNMWGFGPDNTKSIPSNTDIQRILPHTKFEVFKLDNQALQKTSDEAQLDFSAIAKGYAVDVIAEHLVKHKINHYYVEIGGDLRVAGFRDAKKTKWKIGIEKPQYDSKRLLQRLIKMTDMSVAGSGDYRNFYTVDGIRYAHTIDPSTGKPVTHHTASTIVFHPKCGLADAWATALLTLGSEKGLKIADQNNIAVIFVDHSGTDENAFTESFSKKYLEIQSELR